MKMKYIIFCLLFILPLAACNRYENIKKWPDKVDRYDPAKPIQFNVLKPVFGAINNTFILEGNFPGDLAGMKVYFGPKRAVLIATDGHTIEGLVPKQDPGYHPVSVVIGQDSLVYKDTNEEPILFQYNQTRSVTTIAGIHDNNNNNDGDLSTARFNEVTGVEAVPGVNGDNVWVSTAWWSNRVRFISLDDNAVTTLSSNRSYSSPAVTPDRETLYAVGLWADQHHVVRFDRANGWAPTQIGVQISNNDDTGINKEVWDCAFQGDDTRYLFVMGANAHTVRVDLTTKTYLKLNIAGTLPRSFTDRAHITWGKSHNCFFASFDGDRRIYKLIYDDATKTMNFEIYAGTGGSGFVPGHRLNEAQIESPYGMCVDDLGDIYIVSRFGHFVCRIRGEYVELVAGRQGSAGEAGGDPLDARFYQPQDIAPDIDGNFYIAGGWARTVRKLTIE